MKKRISIAVSVVALALLLIAGTVAVTVAYLTSKTDTVTNTFTVGNVTITLDESKVNADGTLFDAGATRVIANEYHLLPGLTYTKDPTIHVGATSEDCYVFVVIQNNLADIETSIATQLADNGWEMVEEGVYCYTNKTGKAVALSKNANQVVFESITISADVDNTTLNSYAGKTVEVTAYAIQSAGWADTASLAEIWAELDPNP